MIVLCLKKKQASLGSPGATPGLGWPCLVIVFSSPGSPRLTLLGLLPRLCAGRRLQMSNNKMFLFLCFCLNLEFLMGLYLHK